MTAILEVESLSVSLQGRDGPLEAVDALDLSISPGETVCLVGESGSGKTVSALSVTRLIDFKGGAITQGTVRFGNRDLAKLSQREMAAVRGHRIGFVFQEPTTAFDPLFSIGAQIVEVLTRHKHIGREEARRQAVTLLRRVKLTDPERRFDQFPHELSGGMRQRAMIAMALACEPHLLIADEPTTALDVTIQAQILRLLKDIQAETKMAMLLITHDLGIAASMADRVVVMYAGRIVEDAPVRTLFSHPHHPYTRGLLRSVIGRTQPADTPLHAIDGSIPDLTRLPTGCRFHTRCERAAPQCAIMVPRLELQNEGKVACWRPHTEPLPNLPVSISAKATRQTFEAALPLVRATDLVKHYPIGHAWLGRPRPVVRAVDGVSLDIREGETFGLVGESGSGKSTLGRLLLRLERPTSGQVAFDGRDLAKLSGQSLRSQRRDMQMIFQDPYGSIDPRWSIGETIAEPLNVHERLSDEARSERVRVLLEQVGLDPTWDRRFPHQLSGGQRQRVSIARAIALNPRFVVADEAVSALDVSVRAQVINLMLDIKARLGLTYLFIGHELNLVRHVSDRIGVMYLGRLVETGPADEVFERPAHPYTRALLAAIPEPDPTYIAAPQELEGEIPSASAALRGCAFASRCPAATVLCREETPPLSAIGAARAVACHHPI
jgi:peptide/nickel transport system ATP-binding protein